MTNSSSGVPSNISSSTSVGCQSRDIYSSAVYASGSTIPLPSMSGQPSPSLPCGRLSGSAYAYGETQAQASTAPSAKNISASSSQSPLPTDMGTLKYKDSNLTGCYAGTGGSTTLTLTSGDQFMVPGASTFINVLAEPQTFSFSCSEFFQLQLPWRLMTSFAESPVCASYIQEEPRDLWPPGVQNGGAHIPFSCCGGCQLGAPEVQLLYWSTTSSAECYQGIVTARANLPGSSEAQRSGGLNQSRDVGFAIFDGSTLTSPSLYLAFHGAVSVTDYCRQRGEIHNNPTIAIAPGDLSTLSFHNNQIVFDGFTPRTDIFDPGACRTYGISNATTSSALVPDYDSDGELNGVSTWYTTVSYSMGPPYNPILLPPKQLSALDPAWAACTSWDSYGQNAYAISYGLYDPPHVLTAMTAMVDPSITPHSPLPQETPVAPRPVGPISPPAPTITAAPKLATSSSDPVGETPDPVMPSAGLASFILRPFNPDPSISVNDEDPAVPGNIDLGLSVISLNPAGSSQPTITIDGTPYTANENSQYVVGSQTLSPGASPIYVKGATYSIALPSAPDPASIEQPAPPSIGGKNVQQVPGVGVLIGSTTVAQGSQAIVQGATISVGSSDWIIDGSIYALPPASIGPGAPSPTNDLGAYQNLNSGAASAGQMPPATSAPSIAGIFSLLSINTDPVLTIDGNAYTADSAGQYVIGSQTLVPGGPSITVKGVPYAIPSSVTAIVSAGNTVALNSQNTANARILSEIAAGSFGGSSIAQIYTMDGASDANVIVVGGTVLIPGSPPHTMDGHVLSLANGGTLVVDGSTSVLPFAATLGTSTQPAAAIPATSVNPSSNSSNVVAYTGTADRKQARSIMLLIILLVLINSFTG